MTDRTAQELVGHWKLDGDCMDSSGNGNDGENCGVALTPEGGIFNGVNSYIQVQNSETLALGRGEFSIAAWIHTEEDIPGTVGDILSKFNFAHRKGFNFAVVDNLGSVCPGNYRNVHFGIDDGSEPVWGDCGRLGNAVWVPALTVYNGGLYAATYEPEAGEAGHVYRYAGGQEWTNCGAPDDSNCVGHLMVHEGKLYATTGCYDGRNSALPVSPNTNPGGRIFRFDGEGEWTDCGSRGSPFLFRGKMHRYSIDKQGFYLGEGDDEFVSCPMLAKQRLTGFSPFHGHLYARAFDVWPHDVPTNNAVYRYDGSGGWIGCGIMGVEGQIYSLAIHRGELYSGTWPSCKVFRYRGGREWEDYGHLGGPNEKEAMGLAVYNGKLYCGTLPMAEVYRCDGSHYWTKVGRVDFTPDMIIRRAWSLAVYDGKLFVGTLPSGRVHAMEAGQNATCDSELPFGWKHLAAVREKGQLKIYIDGELKATSSRSEGENYDLSSQEPLRIGFGAHDYFCGKMADVRIYGKALIASEVEAIYGSTQDQFQS